MEPSAPCGRTESRLPGECCFAWLGLAGGRSSRSSSAAVAAVQSVSTSGRTGGCALRWHGCQQICAARLQRRFACETRNSGVRHAVTARDNHATLPRATYDVDTDRVMCCLQRAAHTGSKQLWSLPRPYMTLLLNQSVASECSGRQRSEQSAAAGTGTARHDTARHGDGTARPHGHAARALLKSMKSAHRGKCTHAHNRCTQ